MFPTSDNPAERLLAILTQIKNQNDNTVVSQVFGNLFGFPHTDKVSFYRTIGYLNELVDQVETRVKAIPSLNHDLYLREIPALRSVVCPNGINDSWGHYSNPLKFGALTGLEFCANELKKTHAEANLSEKDLLDLKSRIDELYKAVSASDLDPDLKSVIFDLLSTIRLSIDYYRVKGTDGLKRAVTYCAGLVKLHQERFASSKSDVSVKGVIALLGKVVELVKGAYKLKELAPAVIEFLHLNA